MNDALTHLAIEAEDGGFQVEIVWPAASPRYLVFRIVGDTTPRGLAAAIELREMFNSSAGNAQNMFDELLSTGAVLHPVHEPQKLFPVEDEPGSDKPLAVGDEVIFLHDGPNGGAVLTKIEHIEPNGLIRIDVPAGSYLFPSDGGLQCAEQRPDTAEAAKLDTWLMPASKTNRAIYLSREDTAGAPADQMEILIRHSPPNGRALQ